ncbi:MAG TPA: AraC family transcriptional regulator [Chitinophaga sp.]|uniref:helix-turn-helix domain-containing protein n=1 Tax=Chitinophaga sp. TaxID=1869181 RepID=UPI002B6EF36C|nr:AraC family transcriptional regulator [Chitinophaga sp.]HVI46427.1 AraC family transcriptional regulator [Chitinophaga sp.]
MGVTFRNKEREIVHSQKHVMDGWATKQPQDWKAGMPFWNVQMKQQYVDGIHMGDCTIDIFEDIEVSTNELEPMPGLLFVQNGQLSASPHGAHGERQFSSCQHSMLVNPYSTERSCYREQRQMRIFIMSILPERFLQLADNGGPMMAAMADYICGGKSKPEYLSSNLPITPRMQLLIDEINSCDYEGGLKDLFLQAKALELLVLQCHQFEQAADQPKTTGKIREADIRKLYLAKEILLKDLQHPPTLASLARQTGLNEFKLKAGFREVFHDSVFGCFKKYRLAVAHRLLTENRKPVTEVAYETGYSTVQHFSNEFKKHFGISPARAR